MNQRLNIRANAKLNLGLEVIRKRNDGYHDINTIFTKINYSDQISINESNELEVIMHSDDTIKMEDNICYKAAKLIQSKYNRTKSGARIEIQKYIPIGAGLAGGSSNAASVIKLLNLFWDLNIPVAELRDIGLKLGSDVPFFFGARTAIGKGRGELLEFYDISLPWYILLVNPGIHISTQKAYSELNVSNQRTYITDYSEIIKSNFFDPDLMKAELTNDFEIPIFSRYPQLKLLKEKLYHSGAKYASMSGSGSTMFGLYSSEDEAIDAQEVFYDHFVVIVSPFTD